MTIISLWLNSHSMLLLMQFYKKSWDDSFAFNSNLNVGETPEWHPYDLIKDLSDDKDDKAGGVYNLLIEIRNFLEVLQSKLPLQNKSESNSQFNIVNEDLMKRKGKNDKND